MSRWTPDEIAMVKRYYPAHGPDLSKWPELPDHSAIGIRRFANDHGIRYRVMRLGISDRDARTLAKAWAMIAKRLGIDKYELVGELCQLRRRRML